MFALIDEAKQNIQGYSLRGTVGNIPFSAKNVVGNFTVSAKASNPSSFNLGNVGIGQLTGTLHGLNIERNSWKGKYITPVVTIGEYVVPFPSKRYRIEEATHTKGMVNFTAYDDMNLFEKAATVVVGSNGTPYDFLYLACSECGVEFGMTEEQVRLLPNGAQPIVLEEMSDIKTWRDVLYWIGVTCCSFSVINREGKLELRAFHNSVDDTIPAKIRYDGALYDDEVVTYTGIYVNITEENAAKYYAAESDDGYSLVTGTNPFLQGTEAQRQVLASNTLSGLSNIGYISGNIEIPFGFHYDLGDVLQFPGGNGSSTNKFCIMGYEYTYNGRCKLTGIPGDKKSKSKSDKDIQGLLNKVSKDEVASYEVKNTSIIRIGNNENKKLVSVRMASNTDTKALIHIEVNLESVAITPQTEYELEVDEETGITVLPFSYIWQDIADTVTHGIVTYLVNSEEVDLHPTESWVDGKHALHLMYVLGVQQGITSTFDAYMKSEGGTIMIQRGGVWLYAQGVGLVGDGKWDGTIKLEDELSGWSLIEIGFESASDRVTVNTQAPVSISLSDNASGWQLVELGFESAGDVLNINMYTETYVRVTEEENTRITEDGLTRFTEGD